MALTGILAHAKKKKTKKKQRHNKKKNSTHENTLSVTRSIYIEYVKAKKKFFAKNSEQSYAAQEGPKYRGQ